MGRHGDGAPRRDPQPRALIVQLRGHSVGNSRVSTQKPVLSQQIDMPSQLGRQSPERHVLLQPIPQGDPSFAGSLSRQRLDVPAHIGVA